MRSGLSWHLQLVRWLALIVCGIAAISAGVEAANGMFMFATVAAVCSWICFWCFLKLSQVARTWR